MTSSDSPDCLFCKIVAGELPAEIVASSDTAIAFRDRNPRASIHVLVVPRDHHEDVVSLARVSPGGLADLVKLGAQVAERLAGGQFRLVFNNGAEVGQSVAHVHGHVLAGAGLPAFG